MATIAIKLSRNNEQRPTSAKTDTNKPQTKKIFICSPRKSKTFLHIQQFTIFRRRLRELMCSNRWSTRGRTMHPGCGWRITLTVYPTRRNKKKTTSTIVQIVNGKRLRRIARTVSKTVMNKQKKTAHLIPKTKKPPKTENANIHQNQAFFFDCQPQCSKQFACSS